LLVEQHEEQKREANGRVQDAVADRSGVAALLIAAVRARNADATLGRRLLLEVIVISRMADHRLSAEALNPDAYDLLPKRSTE
jgi:hypothetical protein